MFDHYGCIRIVGKVSVDLLLEQLLEFDIVDIKPSDHDTLVICSMKALDHVRNALKQKGYEIESAQFEWIAKIPLNFQKMRQPVLLICLMNLKSMMMYKMFIRRWDKG